LKARFIRPFGRFGAGNEIDLPDGVEFDHTYLELVPEPEPEADGLQEHEEKPEADAKPEAPKEGDK
jgi:hypothetical protein